MIKSHRTNFHAWPMSPMIFVQIQSSFCVSKFDNSYCLSTVQCMTLNRYKDITDNKTPQTSNAKWYQLYKNTIFASNRWRLLMLYIHCEPIKNTPKCFFGIKSTKPYPYSINHAASCMRSWSRSPGNLPAGDLGRTHSTRLVAWLQLQYRMM